MNEGVSVNDYVRATKSGWANQSTLSMYDVSSRVASYFPGHVEIISSDDQVGWEGISSVGGSGSEDDDSGKQINLYRGFVL